MAIISIDVVVRRRWAGRGTHVLVRQQTYANQVGEAASLPAFIDTGKHRFRDEDNPLRLDKRWMPAPCLHKHLTVILDRPVTDSTELHLAAALTKHRLGHVHISGVRRDVPEHHDDPVAESGQRPIRLA